MALRDLRRGANDRGPMPVRGGMNEAVTQAGIGQGLQSRGFGAAYDSLGMARDAAMGMGGPSLAQQQLAAGSQANVVNQMGLAAQAQGGSLASQQRSIAGMGAASGMALNRDAGMMRMQEQQAAQAAYAQQAQGLAGMGMQANQFAQGQFQGAAGQVYQGQMDWQLQQRALDQQALENRRRFGQQVAAGVFEAGKGVVGMAGGMPPGMGGGM